MYLNNWYNILWENSPIGIFLTLQTEDEEFEHFIDEDEFEGFEKDKSQSSKSKEGQPELKMADVRSSPNGILLPNWDIIPQMGYKFVFFKFDVKLVIS